MGCRLRTGGVGALFRFARPAWLALLLIANSAATDPSLRIPEEGEALLETPVFSYRKGSREVTLVGTVHIADRAYYQDIQKRLTAYEAVLFEMVGGEDPAVRKSPPNSFASHARALGLFPQAVVMDYTRENFVPADVSRVAYTGETSGTGPVPDLALIAEALAAGDTTTAKRTYAKALASPTIPAGDPHLIKKRNAHCLAVLEKTDSNKIAILYGTAHLPGLAEALRSQGYNLIKASRLVAWRGKNGS